MPCFKYGVVDGETVCILQKTVPFFYLRSLHCLQNPHFLMVAQNVQINLQYDDQQTQCLFRTFQERRAIAHARAHTRLECLRRAIHSTRKYVNDIL